MSLTTTQYQAARWAAFKHGGSLTLSPPREENCVSTIATVSPVERIRPNAKRKNKPVHQPGPKPKGKPLEKPKKGR